MEWVRVRPRCLEAHGPSDVVARRSNFYYLFSYEDTRDAFKIPHDLKILNEVFKCPDGSYRRDNAFWTCHAIADLIEALPAGDEKVNLQERRQALAKAYADMSQTYQDSKANNDLPLS